MRAVLAGILVITFTASWAASAARADSLPECKRELDARGLTWKRATRPGIADAVELTYKTTAGHLGQ
ncbi:MAG: hypothetical protein WKG01_05675, partial [Kofleriaceae bacterium]